MLRRQPLAQSTTSPAGVEGEPSFTPSPVDPLFSPDVPTVNFDPVFGYDKGALVTMLGQDTSLIELKDFFESRGANAVYGRYTAFLDFPYPQSQEEEQITLALGVHINSEGQEISSSLVVVYEHDYTIVYAGSNPDINSPSVSGQPILLLEPQAGEIIPRYTNENGIEILQRMACVPIAPGAEYNALFDLLENPNLPQTHPFYHLSEACLKQFPLPQPSL